MTNHGRINESVKQNIGYPLILWSLDTRDWDHRNRGKEHELLLKNIEDGSIIIMHDLYKLNY